MGAGTSSKSLPDIETNLSFQTTAPFFVASETTR